MIVLHGAWMDARFHLWGELPLNPARRPAAPRSPFDADALSLARALAAVCGGGVPAARAGHARAATAWLPGDGDSPLPSSPALLPPGAEPAAAPAGRAPPCRPWAVTALPLSVPEQGALLAACVAGRRLVAGVLAGPDLEAWCALWRFAGALVARQAHLPGLLERADGRFESRWLPVLGGGELLRLQRLAAGLPPAACCLAPGPPGADGAAPTPALTPAEAARQFVEDAVDRLVRSAAATPLSRAHALKGRFTCAHAAWLASLRGDGRRVRWTAAAELRVLGRALTDWRRPIELGGVCGCRLALALDEPAARPARPARRAAWRLRYELQRVGAPAAPPDEAAAAPARREFALTALGQAAGLCPLIGADPARADADGQWLDTGEAYTFLTVYAPLLRDAGFAVVAPPWWTEEKHRPHLRLRARAETPPSGGRGGAASLALDDLVTVNWELALGEETVSLRDLEGLAAAGEPLVRFRGQWIEVDRTRFREAARLWRKRRREPLALRDLLRLAVGADGAAHGLDVAGVAGRGVVGDILRRLRGESRLEELPPPEGFVGTLRPYQLRGYAWLAYLRQWGLGGCLADDMGLGKTIQALALFVRERARGEKRPVLLVCPMSLIGNWLREAARFTPQLPVYAHHGPARALGRLLATEAGQQALVVTSYGLLHRDFASLRRVPWAGVVLDEAQNIKNPDTRQSRAARALVADYRLALTGTPVENRVGDLWALMDFLNPGLLGTRAGFHARFQRPIQTGVDTGARATLRQVTAPFVLRRLKSDREVIADLPARIESKVFCPLTREQAALYAAELRALDEGLDASDAASRRGLVLATLTRLKQICNHPAHFLGDASPLEGRSGKLARFEAMLEELTGSGDRALVFTQYAAMGALLRSHLCALLGCDIPFLHGGLPRAARERMVERFQAADGPPLFVLSLKAGGTGLNLTRANHVFHFDRWWNPAVENQATDRAHRIGQTRSVFVHKFICAGTLEERIDALIESKTSLAADLIDSGESWLTDLSNAQLRDVLALAADAVAEEEP